MAVSMTTSIEYPFTVDKVRSLKLGEVVNVSGKIFTGRDRLHRYLADGGASPVNLRNGAMFHCGPAFIRRDRKWITIAAGPTTSMREEPYMAKIIQKYGLRVIIGKGGMGPATRKACADLGCVYLQAVGGAAQVINERINEVTGLHFQREFGFTEALWELDVSNLPAIVAIDASGKSLHKRTAISSKRALGKLLRNSAPFKW